MPYSVVRGFRDMFNLYFLIYGAFIGDDLFTSTYKYKI
jgi:hypothetical protein